MSENIQPKNIQEFVSEKIIEYLKKYDKNIDLLHNRIKHLEAGIKMLQHNEAVHECIGCKKWIDIYTSRKYDIHNSSCLGCVNNNLDFQNYFKESNIHTHTCHVECDHCYQKIACYQCFKCGINGVKVGDTKCCSSQWCCGQCDENEL